MNFLTLITLLFLPILSSAVDRYVIFPNKSIQEKQAVKLADLIAKHTTGGKDQVYTSMRPPSPIPAFWSAPLDDAGLVAIKAQPPELVRGVERSRIMAKPFTGSNILNANATIAAISPYTTQVAAVPELRVLSQPPGGESIDKYPNYVYRSDPLVRDAYIYHAELGIDEGHEDFAKRKGGRDAIEWVYTPYAIALGMNNTRTESPHSPIPGHSTCTASKAAGQLYGASRNTKLIIVKMPDYSMESILEILWSVHDHIWRHRREFSSVLSISWGSDGPVNPSNPGSEWESVYYDLLTMPSLVPIVCAAGNSALDIDPTSQKGRHLVDTAPAIWSQRLKRVKSLLPVGNVDIYGIHDQQSQVTNEHQIHAPGVDITCAKNDTSNDVRQATGTSYCKTTFYSGKKAHIIDTRIAAAPLVAGVLAEDMIYGRRYERLSWGPRPPKSAKSVNDVLWNRVDALHNPPTSAETNHITLVGQSINDTATS